jgi:hypothetical protein
MVAPWKWGKRSCWSHPIIFGIGVCINGENGICAVRREADQKPGLLSTMSQCTWRIMLRLWEFVETSSILAYKGASQQLRLIKGEIVR